MKPSQIKSLLLGALKDKRRICIKGKPGVGKTAMLNLIRAEAGCDLILSHTAVWDTINVTGMPWIEAGKATFNPFGDVKRAIEADRPTIWFWDDFGQTPPSVQNGLMQWLLGGECNGHKLSEHVVIWCATNDRTHRSNVVGLSEAVKNRFHSIVEFEPDLAEWCEWAIDADLAIEVVSFVRFRPDLFCAFEPTADLTTSPTPRSWHHVSDILKMQLPADVEALAINGAIGEAAGGEFNAFVRMFRTLPSVDSILLTPDTAPIPADDETSTLVALCTATAARTTEQNFDQVSIYVKRLMKANKGEFAALLVRDAIRRQPDIRHTRQFVKMAVGEFGDLISGKAA